MHLNVDWYDENEQRNFPFADKATFTTVDNISLPQDIIVDATIIAVDTDWPRIYLSGVTVSPHLATAVFTKAEVAEVDDRVAFTVSVADPIPYKSYAVESLEPGVYSGWVTFGSGVVALEDVHRYTLADRSVSLVPKCITVSPTTSLYQFKVDRYAGALTGVVALKAAGDVRLAVETRAIPPDSAEPGVIERCQPDADCICRDVLAIHLDTSSRPDAMSAYAGNCVGRAETDTCGKPVIRFMNELQPMCDGNVLIDLTGEVDDVTKIHVAGSTAHGVYLDAAIAMASICEARGYTGPTDNKECDIIDYKEEPKNE